jgi:hypothetical protein
MKVLKHGKRAAAAGAAVGLVSSGLGALLPTSAGATSNSTPIKKASARTTLRVKAFNRKIAAQHGVEILTAPDGNEAAYLTSDLDAARVRMHRSASDTSAAVLAEVVPKQEVGDECGTAFVDIYWTGNEGEYREDTGWDLAPGVTPAIVYYWQELIDGFDSSHHAHTATITQSGGLADRTSWRGGHTGGVAYTPQPVSVTIPPTNWIGLDDLEGTICYGALASAGPATIK